MFQTGRGTACTWASIIRMLCVQSPQQVPRKPLAIGWIEDDEPLEASCNAVAMKLIVGMEWCRVVMPYSRLRLRYVTAKFPALYGSLIIPEVDDCIYTSRRLGPGCR